MDFIYWEYEHNGVLSDGQYVSEDDAHENANIWWASYCEDVYAMRNGDTHTDEICIVMLSQEDEGVIELNRVYTTVEYQHYHGDVLEHGTWHAGGAGVI